MNSAVYRVTADSGAPYFLKLRQGNFNEIAVAVRAFLHAQGIRQVMAPIATTTHTLWVHAHSFDWILHPYFDGKTGFEAALSKTQWIELGLSMNAVHATILPAGSVERVPREEYSPVWRNVVKAFHKQVQQDRYDDPTAASFAALWLMKRDEILTQLDRLVPFFKDFVPARAEGPKDWYALAEEFLRSIDRWEAVRNKIEF